MEEQPQQRYDYHLQFASNLNEFTDALDKNDKMSVQKLLKNKFKGKALAAASAIAKNDTKMNEIKRRATALHKKEVVKSRWQDIGIKNGLKKEDENYANSVKAFKVPLAEITKAVLAQERRKHLEEDDISKDETNMDKIKRETNESRDILLDIEERGADDKNSIPNAQNNPIFLCNIISYQ